MQWLLFIPQVPARPDYLRVKMRRRLEKLGALLLKSSVYVLPHEGDCLEDFAWLRQDLRKDGGDALICTTSWVAGLSDAEVVEQFNRDRTSRYEAVVAEAQSAAGLELPSSLARLRRKLGEITDQDFFNAEGRAEAERAVRALDTSLQRGRMAAPAASVITAGQTWVTRAGARIDRIGSAWLIRRFIDPQARFVFVKPDEYQHTGAELRFDMFEGEFTHRDGGCTFETLIAHFDLRDPALRAVGEIVHDIDMKEVRYDRAEAAGFNALIVGLVSSSPPDTARLERGFVLFDALYENFRQSRV